LTVLLAIIAVFAVPMAAVLFYRASLLQGVLDGTTLDLQAAQAVDAVVAIVSVLYGILFVATGVVFVIWQYRHGKNARLLGPPQGLGPGWAIGGWFVPFANYVLPAMQLFGASRFSDPAVVETPNGRGRGARIVIPWAIVFGLGSNMVFVSVLAEPSGSYEDRVRAFVSADQISAVGQVLMVVAAILAIVMVRSLSSRQERTLDARAGVGPAISDARAAYGSAPWQPSGQAWGSAPAQPGTPWTQPGAAQPNPYVAPGDAAPAAPPVPPVTPPPMPSAPPAPPA
jgi:hypothetical protein